MTDLINNVIALPISSRDRVNIGDSTTDFTIALKKSLRNIASLSVAGVVIPRNDTLIGPNNDTITGAVIVDDSINLFSVSITRTNYTETALAAELQTVLNTNTDMLSFGITFAVSYSSITNRMTITATYPFGATHTWSIQIDFTSLRDVIGIGSSGTTSQTFTAATGSTSLNISCLRTPSLVRALSYNITSSALTNSVNTSYITSLGKLFNVNSSNNMLTIESQLITNAHTTTLTQPFQEANEFTDMSIGSSVSLSTTGNIMAVGSQRFGVFIFTRPTTFDPWTLFGDGPIRDESNVYGKQGYYVALSGDGTTLVFSALNRAYVYIKSSDAWIQQKMFSFASTVTRVFVSLSIDGSTLAIAADNTSTSVLVSIYLRMGGTWTLQTTLTPPVGTVWFGSGGISLSNTGNNLVVGDAGYATTVAFVYLRTGVSWALQQTIVPPDAIGGLIEWVSISGDGNYLALSSLEDNSSIGATWIYLFGGVTWAEQQKILVKSGRSSLNIAGDTLVFSQTSVYVYKRTVTTWTAQLTNYVGTGDTGDSGYSVSINGSGNDIIWGVRNDNSAQGAVWSSHRTGSTWVQVGTKVTSMLGVVVSNFGRYAALSEDGKTLAAGFPSENVLDGFVYVYVTNGISWVIEAKISNDTPGIGGRFGTNLSLSANGNTLAISSAAESTNGAIRIFTRTAGVWTRQARLVNAATITSQGSALVLGALGTTVIFSGEFSGVFIYTRIADTWVEKVANLGKIHWTASSITQIDISADETVIVTSSGTAGAGVVVFKLINLVWTQVGANFATFYTPLVANVNFGCASSISASGTTISVGDVGDNTGQGATFIFTESAGVWSQQAILVGTLSGATDAQGRHVALLNNGLTCITSSVAYSGVGGIWIFDYDGTSWVQRSGVISGYGVGFGTSISVQKTGLNYVIGAPTTNSGADTHGFMIEFAAAGSTYAASNMITIPDGVYSVFDIINVLNSRMKDIIAIGNGYHVTFNGSTTITLASVIASPIISNTMRVATSSTFDIARWPSQEYKSSRQSNLMDFSINNNVIKSIVNHSDNADNVIVDNIQDAVYRKYPAGFTIEAGVSVDIQLRSNRDQLIDLNGADWIMTLYATVRS